MGHKGAQLQELVGRLELTDLGTRQAARILTWGPRAWAGRFKNMLQKELSRSITTRYMYSIVLGLQNCLPRIHLRETSAAFCNKPY